MHHMIATYWLFSQLSKSSGPVYGVKRPRAIQIIIYSGISTYNLNLVMGKLDGSNSLMDTSFSVFINLANKTLSLMHSLGNQIISRSVRFSFHMCISHRTFI